ncbi:ubiquitin-conjugating enzyme/RWD-like protein [Leucosporidium creatinivorum]|uniref:Ubiquitin-conjugating enzyme/RWD-like protein n=1 Tax=Leucosporidium creatinivorum TaxID=106004 RepID=A0A1Y2C9H1_9BASI|nr:ubiquitin-conjugating enzyme/RWD-like protein [Leucosporidium creatinivorum]
MTDYAEERRSELEVLESIFPDELNIISEDKLSIRVEPEVQSPSEPYALNLTITYTPLYPDELPLIELDVLEGELNEDEVETLINGLKAAGEDSLGMAMVYTLSSYLRDSIAEVVRERKARIFKEENERALREEEEAAKKTAGTKVTPASFAAWKLKFEAEMEAKRAKEEQERLKTLPPKEREEVKKVMGKQSGRELFESEKNASLITSDSAFDEEGAEEVDLSQYEREGLDSDDEELARQGEGLKLGELSDDD